MDCLKCTVTEFLVWKDQPGCSGETDQKQIHACMQTGLNQGVLIGKDLMGEYNEFKTLWNSK